MASIPFTFCVRDNTSTPPGNRITGLTPSWVFLKSLATLLNVTQPSISEIADGQYMFFYDAEANDEAAGQIDAGSSLTNPSDRYIDVLLTKDSSRVQVALPNAGYGNAGGLNILEIGVTGENPRQKYPVKIAPSSVATVASTIQTIVGRLIAAIARSDVFVIADLAAELAIINQNYGTGVGSYDNTADSEQAIRNALGTVVSPSVINAIVAGIRSSGVIIRIVSPVSPDGKTLALTIGDAYTVFNGQPVVYDIIGLKDLASAGVKLGIGSETDGDIFQVAGQVVTHGAGTQIVLFEIPSALTNLLDADDKYRFNIQIEWAGTGSGEPYSPVLGDCITARKWTT